MFAHLKYADLKAKQTTNIDGNRHYTVREVVYPSVTTILSKTNPGKDEGLRRWRERVGSAVAAHIMTTAREVGTATHQYIEQYLNNELVMLPQPLLPYAHFTNLRPMLDQIDNIRALEKPLFCSAGYAGTVDCVAEYEGVLSIIDFKTMRTMKRDEWMVDYYLQTSAYAMAWDEMYDETPTQTVILCSAEDGTSKVVVHGSDEHIAAWDRRLTEFQKL